LLREEHHFLDKEIVEKVSRTFKALADPTRIKILYLLSQEECHVNHIADVLELTQSAISHQLAYLKNAHLVKAKRQGKTVYYSCADQHVLKLLQMTIEHQECL
jgi:DNA-binding transcriptional ArsR family regulator